MSISVLWEHAKGTMKKIIQSQSDHIMPPQKEWLPRYRTIGIF